MKKNNKLGFIGLAGFLAVIGIIVTIIATYRPEKEPSVTPPEIYEEPERDEPVSPGKPTVDYTDDTFQFTDEMPDLMLSHNSYFYKEAIALKIYSRKEASIHYTLDGSRPTTHTATYDPEKGIALQAGRGDDPKVHTVHIIAFYEDGTESEELVHSYILGKYVDSRYENMLIFCISGDPADLTKGPSGILFGLNYEQRGMESERPVNVEILNRSGSLITDQKLGVRVNGAYNRQNSQKSLKFFARKSYSPEAGTTYLNCFDFLDAEGAQIVRYDKFVLRASGNDFRFAFVRDELNQMLAKDAGFNDYEPVFPAIAYMNGEYFGFYWLHASYCDEFFKNKYGDSPAKKLAGDGEYKEGEFVVLAGTDEHMHVDEDDELAGAQADEFNSRYAEFAAKDLRNETNYRELCSWMDVNNYLDYMAYNIYLCNKDWPNNNVRCYRYVPAPGEPYGEGAYDGRWRHLLHDIDYTLGLYGQDEVLNSYDTLKQILGNGDRSSALFIKLMERPDCKEYFIKKSLDYGAGALSYSAIASKLDAITKNRANEMPYYYDFLRGLGKEDVSWVHEGQLPDNLEAINTFASRRADRSADYLKFNLSLSGTKYTLNVLGDSGARLVVNSFTAKEGSKVNGVYFTDYETVISAVYRLGKAFDYWEVNGTEVRTPRLTITGKDVKRGLVNITLHVKDAPVDTLYISSFHARTDDSVTITNVTAGDVSLSGYILSDGSYDYRFADGDTIKAGESITVYCNNTDVDPEKERKTIFNLSEGETITLKDASGRTIDSAYVPNSHVGYTFKRNLFTMQFEETR